MEKSEKQQKIEELTALLDKVLKDEDFEAAARAAAASLTRLGVSQRGYVFTVVATQALRFPNSV